MKIKRVKVLSTELLEAFDRLLPQLYTTPNTPSAEYIEELLKNEYTHLFVAEVENRIVGTLSLAIVDLPSGRKAWIEDVVVDEAARGRCIGQLLVEKAKEEAFALGATKVYLTSNPSRKAAHALYHKCGFKVYDTALFRIYPR